MAASKETVTPIERQYALNSRVSVERHKKERLDSKCVLKEVLPACMAHAAGLGRSVDKLLPQWKIVLPNTSDDKLIFRCRGGLLPRRRKARYSVDLRAPTDWRNRRLQKSRG